MLPFDLLFRDIKSNDLTTSRSNSIKSKLLDTAFISYNILERKRSVSNLSETELNVLENLTKNKNKNLVIQKADKGNTVVIINKNVYKTKIKDPTKFKKLEIGENKQLNFLINNEKKVKDIIKTLCQKECLTKKE